MTKLFVLILGFAGLIISMLVPIMCLGFIGILIWGPEFIHRPLYPTGHPAAIVVTPVVLLATVVCAYLYLAIVFLPLCGAFKIPLRNRYDKYNYLIGIAVRSKKFALKYRELMDRLIKEKT